MHPPIRCATESWSQVVLESFGDHPPLPHVPIRRPSVSKSPNIGSLLQTQMYSTKQPRPRLRAGLSRPIRVTPKHMPPGASATPSPLPPPFPIANRIPLHPVPQSQCRPSPAGLKKPQAGQASTSDPEKEYFKVLYTKRSKKKRKSWLDGYVILTNDRHVELLDENGKRLCTDRFSKPMGGLKSGNTLEINSWELEVQDPVAEAEYISGKVFAPPTLGKPSISRPTQRPFKPLRTPPLNGIANKMPIVAHNPDAPNAIVLLPKSKRGSETTVPIVLDPYLAKRMRPHQHEGIKFLFDCTAGRAIMDEDGCEGAILADEMGLGKSLQAIALIWTLVKQGPSGRPLAKKAIIVCPASLVRNWVNEVRKWLGSERLEPIAIESGVSSYGSKEALQAFCKGDKHRLLIISYESFRSNGEDLYKASCELLVCDEGHRLKSAGGNKTVASLRKLPCRRRVILTGTPVQNDLEEFFAVCDFVNPGCLNALNSFRSVFANPIIASRDSNASDIAKSLGAARAKELSRITSKFVLRRTADILEKYLPPKHETAIFCRLQPKQEDIYQREAYRRFKDITGEQGMAFALQSINYLRKICSHPLLFSMPDDYDESNVGFEGSAKGDVDEQGSFPIRTEDIDGNASEDIDVNESGKMQVTASICRVCVQKGDRLIIVSNFTTVLDLMETMLSQLNIEYCRLDGKTPVNQRGDIVRRFNEGSLGDVFLLSARAGGVGLNLIGANRLILFDPDWNPATDIQAMARVWRDGQKKHVFVYRLLCTGTIEEKIFQRQLFKGELQDAVEGESEARGAIGGIGKDGNFKAEELRDVFKYSGDVAYCETLDVLERSKEDTKKAGLLEQFQAYKLIAEKEKVTNAVWCEDDAALDQALNGDMDTHGLVSYLYTKTFGAMLSDVDEFTQPSCNKSRVKSEKRKVSALLSDSDDDNSDEELYVSEAERIFFNSSRCEQESESSTRAEERFKKEKNKRFCAGGVEDTVDLTNDDDQVEQSDDPIVVSPSHDRSNTLVNGDDDITTTQQPAEGGEVIDLMWDEALDSLEDHV